MTRISPTRSALVASLAVAAVLVSLLSPARASLLKPTYTPGDHWVFILNGSLNGFPGLNGSRISNVRFGLVGLVTFEVTGPAGNASVPTIRVHSSATGWLNGSFSLPGGAGTAGVTGTFTTDGSEDWEDQAYLPIASNSATSYRADVTVGIIRTSLAIDFRTNATTSIRPIPRFDLDVGQNATAGLATHLVVNSTFTVFGRTMSMQNSTDISSTWRRVVLSRENVTVEARTFSAYRLNQTLGSFPGLPTGASGGNETAYFSNGVGFYVKRAAYQNGTKVAEMRLKSYSYGAPPPGWTLEATLIYGGIPVAAAILILVVVWRRRKARIQGRLSGPPPPQGGPPP